MGLNKRKAASSTVSRAEQELAKCRNQGSYGFLELPASRQEMR